MIEFIKKSITEGWQTADYLVVLNGELGGALVEDPQGYFFTVRNEQYWNADFLREIANKLDELNEVEEDD